MVVVGISTVPDPVLRTNREISRVDNRSVALLSAPGEPEAVSKIDGLIITPLDGNPLTNAQEFARYSISFQKDTHIRILRYTGGAEYVGRRSHRSRYWSACTWHCWSLDSGGVNTDFLAIVDWTGLILFNGTYTRPELSFKIDDFWRLMNRNNFRQIQIANDSLARRIYIALPDPLRNFLLYADYGNGMDAKNIRWSKWIFDANISSLCLIGN